VELGEAEALGMLDHHHRGVRHVDPDLDHRGRDQKAAVACRKGRHGSILVARRHLAVDQSDLLAESLRQRLISLDRRPDLQPFARLDQRADPVDLLARLDRPADGLDHRAELAEGERPRPDRLSPGRLFPKLGERDVAIAGEHHGPWDRGRGHQQHVGIDALGAELHPLIHAEAVLFVDHHQAEIGKANLRLKQGVGADHDLGFGGRDRLKQALPPRGALASGKEADLDSDRLQQRREPLGMLSCQHLGRRHQGGLRARLDRLQHGQRRDHRLAAADIALKEPPHPLRPRHVAQDLGERALLGCGQGEGQTCAKRRPQPAVAGENAAGLGRPPLPGQGEQKLAR
jgi:hypothetical protein